MTKKTTRTRAEAKRLMWEYYRDNKEWMPIEIKVFREEIIDCLSGDCSTGTVFARFIERCDSKHRVH